eukprot:365802-Chlamydomonas_euryale.AAC.11
MHACLQPSVCAAVTCWCAIVSTPNDLLELCMRWSGNLHAAISLCVSSRGVESCRGQAMCVHVGFLSHACMHDACIHSLAVAMARPGSPPPHHTARKNVRSYTRVVSRVTKARAKAAAHTIRLEVSSTVGNWWMTGRKRSCMSQTNSADVLGRSLPRPRPKAVAAMMSRLCFTEGAARRRRRLGDRRGSKH